MLIVTAANDKYFEFLCDFIDRLLDVSVYPTLIVYDLGLSRTSIHMVRLLAVTFSEMILGINQSTDLHEFRLGTNTRC